MDLARHVSVLWRFRTVTAAGVILGIVLAVAASYKITTQGLVARGVSIYSSQSQVLVTQPGFPEGRVVLPVSPVLGSETEQAKVDPDRLEFADPARFMALADLYTKLLVSDDVRARIPSRPSEKQIVASPLPAVSGAPILPIIQLTVMAPSSEAAQALNRQTVSALRTVLEERQARNDISRAQSVQISILNAPSRGALTAGPSHTAAILALLLCLVGTIAVTHMLASLRPRHQVNEFDDIVSEWEVDEKPVDQRAGEQPIERPALQGPREPR